MAIHLLAVLVVFALAQGLPDLSRLRDFSRLRVWLGVLARIGGGARSVLAILVPVLLCLLVQILLGGWMFGLLSFAFAVCVLWYSWGPRDLSEDIDAVIKAPDSERRVAAALRHRMQGGMLYGGIPAAILGYILLQRRRKWRTESRSGESLADEEPPAHD